MKKLFFTTAIVLVSLLNIQAQEKIKIAVMDFIAGDGVENEMVSGISDLLIELLSKTDKFTIVEQEQLHLMSSASVEQTTETDENFDRKLTGILDYSEIDDEYSLDIRITSVKEDDGIIYITKVIKDESDAINKALRNLMPNFAEELTNRLVEDPDEYVYEIVDTMPSFPGGDSILNQYLAENIRYPNLAIEHNIQGRVICQFTVKNDGSIVNIEVINSVHPYLDKEAVRVIEEMPKWNSVMQDGEFVNVRFKLPINFKLILM
jgi:TonB family C-terminal domain